MLRVGAHNGPLLLDFQTEMVHRAKDNVGVTPFQDGPVMKSAAALPILSQVSRASVGNKRKRPAEGTVV